MWEYDIVYRATNEQGIFFGYNWEDACRRAEVDPSEVDCVSQVYVD